MIRRFPVITYSPILKHSECENRTQKSVFKLSLERTLKNLINIHENQR